MLKKIKSILDNIIKKTYPAQVGKIVVVDASEGYAVKKLDYALILDGSSKTGLSLMEQIMTDAVLKFEDGQPVPGKKLLDLRPVDLLSSNSKTAVIEITLRAMLKYGKVSFIDPVGKTEVTKAPSKA